MLVLGRHENEGIRIGENVIVTVVRIQGEFVRIGIDAPSHVPIVRTELDRDDQDDTEVFPAELEDEECDE